MKTTVRRLAHRVAHGAGQATSSARMLPDFVVAGAQRSGTSSLYRALVQHPNVMSPVLQKGVHYFDLHYDQGLAWYRSHFPLEWSAARVRRRTGAQAHTFESSPYYLFHPLAAGRMAHDLPGVRVISLVRDPVERAFSAHAHELARGFETEPFERAVELEAERTAGERERMVADPTYNSARYQHQAYLARGQYVDQLKNLASEIGRDRLLVVDSHRLFEDAEPALREVYDFLGLSQPDSVVYDKHNARPRAPMDPGLRARLEDHFRPYDEQLAAWVGWTPRWMR
jgi:hypothetical protein